MEKVNRTRLTLPALLLAALFAATNTGCSTPFQLNGGLVELSDWTASLEEDLGETSPDQPRRLPARQLADAERIYNAHHVDDRVLANSIQQTSAEFELHNNLNHDPSLVPAVAIIDVTDDFANVSVTVDPVTHDFSIADKTTPTAACQTSSGDEWGRSREEYVSDGGDGGLRAEVDGKWNLKGLEVEDTIAHFDTLSGDVEIVSSNRAHVYAPRFAAVRQVRNVLVSEQRSSPYASASFVGSSDYIGNLEAGAVKQPLATVRAVGTKMGLSVQQNDRGILIDDIDAPQESRNQLLPYENLEVTTAGIYDQMDSPILLDGSDTAHTWSNVEMAQVTLENGGAFVRTGVVGGQETVIYEMPDGPSKLRLIKKASVCAATPGETISFTIQFENIGDQAIGNITILDMLTSRLKYVDDSEECSVEYDFVTNQEEDALQLRWDVSEALEPGEGGVIQFECIVK